MTVDEVAGESMRKLTDKPPLLAVPFLFSQAVMSRARSQIGSLMCTAVFAGMPGGLGSRQ